ncbi:IQ domain-containing protein IQM2-like protein [Cinnamomum micranthum f. kanehirae]|uniref:IQ domain-containing protein IQM2-like protein n=1 Tax=Cinnamomum micranthum f. kanehirae TaxID=337451 RepID=A0A443NW66_9MAGN|nr:IQ domain-containing protein IQM2-like protein [Cinnamomum micranthum f. kanehirae]
MGLLFSCPFADYDDLRENFEPIVVRSISFNDDNVKTTVRSVSFNGRDAEPKILKSLGSGKMIIEGSVSFRQRDLDSLDLERMISFKVPSLSTPKESAFGSDSFKGIESENQLPASNTLTDANPNAPTSETSRPKHLAAVRLQKVYKSFRTRRRLADCAVLVEQGWWKLLDFAELKQSSVSFFDIEKPETAISRWSRARKRAAKVGKGLSKDEKAQQLALQHWLEAIDPRHRYGHNLHFYYDDWLHCVSRQPFFYWLDVGEGREVNLEQCPRSKLQQQCIKYLGPKEREAYEVIVEDGKFFYKDGKLLDTSEGAKDTKWIFVLSTSKILYVGKKKKGVFQHSSFLAGGATSAAGRLVVEKGLLKAWILTPLLRKAVWPHSGHYRPTEENFQEFMTFLKERSVDLTDVKESPTDEDDYSLNKHGTSITFGNSPSGLGMDEAVNDLTMNKTNSQYDFELKISGVLDSETSSIHIPEATEPVERSENKCQMREGSLVESQIRRSTSEQPYMFHKWNPSEEKEDDVVPPESILRRINSHKGMKSYQLGKQLSFKWTTGAGPRIVCLRDYPTELQFRALEQVNLSPRSAGNSRASASPRACVSPRDISSPRPKPLTTSLLKEKSSSSSSSS